MAGAAETEYTGERALCLESTVQGHHIYKQIWTTLNGEILHAIAENNEVLLHDRFAVALEHFQRWHRTRWRDYLLDNKKSSIPGKGLKVPRACTLL